MRVFSTLDEFAAAAGESLGYSEWLTVDQERINTFADATEDHQWIHVDPERAKDGPFGGTIAHGFLTLSLLLPLWHSVYRVDGPRLGINYGLNRVRFPAPVPSGARIRAGVSIGDVTHLDDAVQATILSTTEIEGHPKPACVAESIVRYFR